MTISTSSLMPSECCRCEQLPWMVCSADGLWVRAAEALEKVEPREVPEVPGEHWVARFALAAHPNDPLATMELTLYGERIHVADFISSGAISLETFDILSEHEVPLDGEGIQLLLLRNSRRTTADHGPSRIDPDSPTDPDPADRTFDVKVVVDQPGVAAQWRIATRISGSTTEPGPQETAVDSPVQASDQGGALELAALSERAVTSATGKATSTSDAWRADGLIRVEATSGSSGVAYTAIQGQFTQKNQQWTGNQRADVGRNRGWIKRAAGSWYDPVSYVVYGPSIRRA